MSKLVVVYRIALLVAVAALAAGSLLSARALDRIADERAGAQAVQRVEVSCPGWGSAAGANPNWC